VRWLRRARLTAGLLQTLESALSEVYTNAPLGSSVIPFPARALGAIVQTLAMAKEAGVDPAQAMQLVDWEA
jgi:hypothetical protein